MPGESPFVGRAKELELLSQRLADARRGHARTVLIGGEAGVGKSRLLSRFAEIARQAGAYVLAGTCEEYFGNPMPYGPLLEVLETFRRDYGPRQAADLGGAAYQRLNAFFELDTDSMSSQPQVFLTVRRMLDDIGSDAPVLLVLEDLHWADPATLDLVRHLGQAHPEDRRLLLACSYRSREWHSNEPFWRLLAGATFLRRTERRELAAFEPSELQEFLAGVIGGRIDPKLVERYREWSDGLPFYAEQLVAAGTLEGSENLELPDDVREVILTRLGGLGSDALKVLRVIAVGGRAMSRQLLRTVSGLTGEALREAVQECFDRQMLVTGHNEDVYRFRHALLREAVYRTTVRDTQVDLHIAMAQALDAQPELSLTEGSAAADQAGHWYQAGIRPQALGSAVRAGEAAERTLAFSSAGLQYTRALELWPQVAEPENWAGVSRGRLLAMTADAARWSGQLDRALEYVRAAIEEAERNGEADRLGELYERLATYLREAGKPSEAEQAVEHAAALLADSPGSAVKARVLAGIALGRLRTGHYTEGGPLADAALTMARQVGARAEEGRALNISGLALGMQGKSETAVERLRLSLEIARSANNIEDLLRAYGNLGLVLEDAGRLREAAEVSRRGLDEARQLDLASTRQGTILANNTSAILLVLGEWAEAEKIITEVSLDRPPAESLYPRLTLAELKVARGDLTQARELLASIENVEHGGDPRFLGPLHTVRALLAMGEGDLDRAVDEVIRGLAAVQDGENALERLRLCAVGMRCAADRASRPGASEQDRTTAMAAGDHLARLARQAVPESPAAEVAQLVLLCRAERQRIRGQDSAGIWNQVAIGWAELDRPYPAAYARWRQASAAHAGADDDEARQRARAAHRAATALGAEPLRAQIAELAKEIGLDLAEHSRQPKAQFGLSPAESEVLRYMTEGYDSTAIAHERGVSKRTVQTQQGKIYSKLDVRNATQAVTKARKEGLFG